MRNKIIAGNWKMNKTLEEGVQLVQEIITCYQSEVKSNAQVVIAPPFIHLSALKPMVSGLSNISLAAQNCSEKASGAFTGEVSAQMLKSVGCSFVILGHSERRQYHMEQEALLSQKIDAVLAQQLRPIYCVGETLEERNQGKHFDIIEGQLKGALFHLSAEQMGQVVIAYEPVWAIGTGVTASSAQAQEMHAFIRRILAGQFGEDLAQTIAILYGGSMKPDNAKELLSQPDIDGGLIGGAALQARSFVDIILGAG